MFPAVWGHAGECHRVIHIKALVDQFDMEGSRTECVTRQVCNTGCLRVTQRPENILYETEKLLMVNISVKSAIPPFSLHLEKYFSGISVPEFP